MESDYSGKAAFGMHEGPVPAPLSPVGLDAGYNGQDKGADWAEKVLGWTAEIVRHPSKVAPQEVMKAWVTEWAKEVSVAFVSSGQLEDLALILDDAALL